MNKPCFLLGLQNHIITLLSVIILLGLLPSLGTAASPSFQIIHSLENQGLSPSSSLIQGSDGALYGTAVNGGSDYGTVITKSTDWRETQ